MFAMRQEKEEWTSWSAQFADAWEEAGLPQLTMDQLKSLTCMMLTDNKVIQEVLLKIEPEKLCWKAVRKVGRQAQGRIFPNRGGWSSPLTKSVLGMERLEIKKGEMSSVTVATDAILSATARPVEDAM